MASFNASVSGETKSKIALEDEKWTRNQTGQCTPIPPLGLGTLKLVSGNGTSIGTVMTLLCPYKHRAVSGGLLSCVQDSNITHWRGGMPECKPVSKFEDEGFHLAVLASIISLAIIIFMSIIFITSCLLKCVRKDEKRRMERKRKKEAAEYWQQMDQQEMRETFYRHKGRNNNNNNSRPQQHTQHSNHQSANNVQPQSLCYVEDAYRFHQQDYPLTVPTNQPPLEVMPPTSFINTQFRNLNVPAATRLSELLNHLQGKGEEACHEFYRALHLHNEDLYLSLPTRVSHREATELSGTNHKPFCKERCVLNNRGSFFFLCCFSIALSLALIHYHNEGMFVTGSVLSCTVFGLDQHAKDLLLSY